MTEEEKAQLEKYKIAIQLMDIELKMQWTIFGAFFIAHSLLIKFLLDNTYNRVTANHSDCYLILIALVGILLFILWWTTFERTNTYYELRMKQAKNAEPKYFELLNTNIRYNLPGKLRTKYACRVLMFLVFIFYLTIIFYKH